MKRERKKWEVLEFERGWKVERKEDTANKASKGGAGSGGPFESDAALSLSSGFKKGYTTEEKRGAELQLGGSTGECRKTQWQNCFLKKRPMVEMGKKGSNTKVEITKVIFISTQ